MKIVIFDFDNTLFFTPKPDYGKIIWENKKGIKWNYESWWSNKNSLDYNVFNIPINPFMKKVYDNYKNNKDVKMILATGRLIKLYEQVKKILNIHNLVFNSIHLNHGINTFDFELSLFKNLIQKHNPKEIDIYDDRENHIKDFYKWSLNKDIKIDIIDVTKYDKTPLRNY